MTAETNLSLSKRRGQEKNKRRGYRGIERAISGVSKEVPNKAESRDGN